MLNSNFSKKVKLLLALHFSLTLVSFAQSVSGVGRLNAYKDNTGSAILTYNIYTGGPYEYYWRYKSSTNKRQTYASSGGYSYGTGSSVNVGVEGYCLKGPLGLAFFGIRTSSSCSQYTCSPTYYKLQNEDISSTAINDMNVQNPRNFTTSPGNRMFFAYNIMGGNNVKFSTNGGATFNTDTANRKMEILQFHPLYDSVLFGRDSRSNLIVSNDTGKTNRLLDTLLLWQTGAQILFDKNLSMYYTVTTLKSSNATALYRSQNLRSWEFVRYIKSGVKIIAGYEPSTVYMLESGVVQFSHNYGTAFQTAYEFPEGVKDIASAYGVDSIFFIKDTVLYARSTNGIIRLFATTEVEQQDESVKSDKTELMQNYPNPAGTYTTISYTLPEPSKVTLKIYNLLGEEVKTVRKGTQLPQGVQKEDIDLSNLPNGVYIYNLEVNGKRESKKMMVVK